FRHRQQRLPPRLRRDLVGRGRCHGLPQLTVSMDSGEWDERHAERDQDWAAEPSPFLVAEAAGLTAGRALDLACGTGRHAVWLAGGGWDVVGVDFSQVGLETARQRAAAHGVTVEWIAADLLDFRPDPHGFDLVVVFYLHLPPEQRDVVLRKA